VKSRDWSDIKKFRICRTEPSEDNGFETEHNYKSFVTKILNIDMDIVEKDIEEFKRIKL